MDYATTDLALAIVHHPTAVSLASTLTQTSPGQKRKLAGAFYWCATFEHDQLFATGSI